MIIDQLKMQGIPPDSVEQFAAEQHWAPLANIKWYNLQRLAHNLEVSTDIKGFITAHTPNEAATTSVYNNLSFHRSSSRFTGDGDAFLTHLYQSSINASPEICAEIRYSRFNRSVQSAVKAATQDAQVTGISSAEIVYAQDYGEGHTRSVSAIRLETTTAVIERMKFLQLLPDEKDDYAEAIIVNHDDSYDYYISSPGELSHHTLRVDPDTLVTAGIQLPEVAHNKDAVYMQLNDLELGIDASQVDGPVEKVAAGRFIFDLSAKRGAVDLLAIQPS